MTTIRCARTYDAPALAELCGELGYPATRQQIVRRLASIEALPANKVFVAEDETGSVIGWLHVAVAAHLAADDVVEVLGLVVTATKRGAGVGKQLLRAAEAWAHSRGISELCVRSRVEREHAHRFYEREGFERRKTQAVFDKHMS